MAVRVEQAVIGIIGTGRIAQNQHLPNTLRAPHIRLKTVCDLQEDVLHAVQTKYAIPKATTDVAELLADEEIQGVIVATEEGTHAELTIQALNAGKHVYVEKPLADTNEACAAVVEVQRQTGKFVAVGFNRRFAPAYRKAKEILKRHGGAWNISYRMSDNYCLGWGKECGYPPGVRVVHEVCHVFDVLRWLTDSEVESLYCVASRPDDEMIVLKFASGCVAAIMNSGYATRDFPKERMEVICANGSLTVEEFVELRTFGFGDFDPVYRFAGHTHPDGEYGYRALLEKEGASVLYALRRAQWELTQEPAEKDDPFKEAESAYFAKWHGARLPHISYAVDKGWIASIEHFAQCIQSGHRPENASAEDAYKACLLSQAALQSREERQIVYLN
ncbi:MAG: Gfo/Idh/MocA family oxidoreductase [Nitrospiraceae bacterium]|nr:Gfo/Idh/MocA family oxidoreductase [Nitrospiraceae bacterium]